MKKDYNFYKNSKCKWKYKKKNKLNNQSKLSQIFNSDKNNKLIKLLIKKLNKIIKELSQNTINKELKMR